MAKQLHEQINGTNGRSSSTPQHPARTNNPTKAAQQATIFGDAADQEMAMSSGGSVRGADQYNYDTLVGGPESSMDMIDQGGHISCCELICGRPSTDEPKFNLICCRVSKRVVKNILMIVTVLLLYCFFLTFIMGGKQTTPYANN